MTRHRHVVCVTAASIACVFLSVSCESTSKQPSTASNDAKPAAAAAPAPAHADHSTPHVIHNMHQVTERLYSGAVPEGDAAFDELASLGVKTIISVDGATPDVARADARGMRYVHVPITYATVTPEQQREIARAMRDLDGPVFMHCHHGRHRGPAAAAAASIALGELSPEEGVAFMKRAGTADNYVGLYACVSSATVLAKSDIDAAPADFSPVRKPSGLVAAMVEVDIAFENLKLIRVAGWKTPADHPDLVPAAEAGRLVDHFRFSLEDPKCSRLGGDYIKQMEQAITQASDLEEKFVNNASAAELAVAYELVNTSCKACHTAYRDRILP